VSTIRQLRSEVAELRSQVAKLQPYAERHRIWLQAVAPDGEPTGPARRLNRDGLWEEHTGEINFEGAVVVDLVPHNLNPGWRQYE
jgi:hypothetical protein